MPDITYKEIEPGLFEATLQSAAVKEYITLMNGSAPQTTVVVDVIQLLGILAGAENDGFTVAEDLGLGDYAVA